MNASCMIRASRHRVTEPLRRAVTAALFCIAPLAAAHEADEQPAAAAPIPTAVPHLEIEQPPLEFVARREDHDLVLYIDDYASNAPLKGLSVEVRAGNAVLQAAESADGTYRIPADLVGDTAQNLAIGIHGAGIDVELAGTLPAAMPADTTNSTTYSAPPPRPLIGIGVVGLAGLGLWLVVRSRRVTPGNAAARLPS